MWDLEEMVIGTVCGCLWRSREWKAYIICVFPDTDPLGSISSTSNLRRVADGGNVTISGRCSNRRVVTKHVVATTSVFGLDTVVPELLWSTWCYAVCVSDCGVVVAELETPKLRKTVVIFVFHEVEDSLVVGK